MCGLRIYSQTQWSQLKAHLERKLDRFCQFPIAGSDHFRHQLFSLFRKMRVHEPQRSNRRDVAWDEKRR
jgi:hypothetical protein